MNIHMMSVRISSQHVVVNICRCVGGAFATSAVQCNVSPWYRRSFQAHFPALYSPARCYLLVPAELSHHNLWNLNSFACTILCPFRNDFLNTNPAQSQDSELSANLLVGLMQCHLPCLCFAPEAKNREGSFSCVSMGSCRTKVPCHRQC